MTVFFVGIAIVTIGVLSGALTYSPFVEGIAMALLISGIVVTMVGVGIIIRESTAYHEESVKICTDKGGIVSDGGLCIVDNKPVEYSPGVWER